MLKFKRMLGLLLTVAMLIGVCPVTVLAETVTTYTGIEVRPQSVSPDVTVGEAAVTLRAASDENAENFESNPDLVFDYQWYYMYQLQSDIPESEANDYALYEADGLSAYIKPVSDTNEPFSCDYIYLCVATVSATSTSSLSDNCGIYPTEAYVKQQSATKIEVAFEIYPESETDTIEAIDFTCTEQGGIGTVVPSMHYMYVYKAIDGNDAPFENNNPVGKPVGTVSINKTDYTPLEGLIDVQNKPQVMLLTVKTSEWNSSPAVTVYGYGDRIIPMSSPYIKIDSLTFGEEPTVTEVGTNTLGVYGEDIAQASFEGWYADKTGKTPATDEQWANEKYAYAVFTIHCDGSFTDNISASDFILLREYESFGTSYIEALQTNTYRISFYVPSERISVSLSVVGDGGEFCFYDYPDQNIVYLDVNDAGMAIRALDIGITVYPGYYVKSIKLNGEIWEDSKNPFYDGDGIRTFHNISNTENYNASIYSFRPTDNSVFEIEFGVADIVTIEYGDNIPCYTGEFANEKAWHSNGKYYVSETYMTALCYKSAIRNAEATQTLFALNTKPDGSGYNVTKGSNLSDYFVWTPIEEFTNGVSDEITLYAILQCRAHESYGASELAWEYFDAKAPTCDTAGNVAYRHCRDCDAYQIVADKTDYDVIDNEEDPSNYTYYKHSTKNGVTLAPLTHDYSQYKSNDENTHTVTCVLCGDTKTESHKLVDGVCICGEGSYLKGDVSDDGIITDADAVHLLFYTIFPEDYTVNQSADYNGDGVVTDADAVYLLFYTIFPEDYPLN